MDKEKNQNMKKNTIDYRILPLALIIAAIALILYLIFSQDIGNRQRIALAHIITSTIASILIIYLAIQLRVKQKFLHKEIAYLMGVFGILSFYFAWNYGFELKISTDPRDMHNLIGFLSLGLSLIPIFVKPGDKYRLHCRIATAAALFAILSIVSGIIAYQHMVSKIFGIYL
jgi:threonine/homoserine efflux transporter RhtA